MKSAISLIALLAALSSTATATIVLGIRSNVDYSLDHVAWIEGEDPCAKMVKINSNSQNPCGSHFTLSNGYTYGEANCGGNDYMVTNADGSPNAVCNYNDNHGQFCQTEIGWTYWKQQYIC